MMYEDENPTLMEDNSATTAPWGMDWYDSDSRYELPPLLYHYTTSEGLRGIVENGKLRGTDRSFLNDSSESSHGYEVAMQHCDLVRDIYSERDDGQTEIADRYLARLRVEYGKALAVSWFVASLCAQPNVLTQWMGYGHQGGYSVGLDARRLRTLGESNRSYILRKVIYQFGDQLEELQNNVDRCVNRIMDEDYDKNSAVQEAVRETLVCLLRYKDAAFEREEEWRLWWCNPSAEEMHFRSRPDLGLIPFVEFDLSRGADSLIREIWIGPTSLGNEAERALKHLLSKEHLHDVEIKRSEIPLRW
jgi:hypothetical protein